MEHGELEPVGLGDVKCSEKAAGRRRPESWEGRSKARWRASVFDGDSGVCPLWGCGCRSWLDSAKGLATAFLQQRLASSLCVLPNSFRELQWWPRNPRGDGVR